MPEERDVVIQKKTPDSFHETNLKQELDSKQINELIIAGIQTEFCVDTTCKLNFDGRVPKMTSPIKNQIRCNFIPVSDIEKAKDWYCKILDLPTEGEIIFGHLFILPMQGSAGIVLDSKIYAPEHVFRIPAIQFMTDDIEQSYAYMKEHNVELVTDIQYGQWFNFKDPDGNVMMVCK